MCFDINIRVKRTTDFKFPEGDSVCNDLEIKNWNKTRAHKLMMTCKLYMSAVYINLPETTF